MLASQAIIPWEQQAVLAYTPRTTSSKLRATCCPAQTLILKASSNTFLWLLPPQLLSAWAAFCNCEAGPNLFSGSSVTL